MMVRTMVEQRGVEPEDDGALRRIARWAVYPILLFTGSVALGLIVSYFDHGASKRVWPLYVAIGVLIASAGTGVALLMRAFRRTGEGVGEQREAARMRQIWLLYAVLAVVVFIAMRLMLHSPHHPETATLSTGVALGVAAMYLIVTVAGSFIYFRRIDEVALHQNYWSNTVGTYVIVCGYPAWYLLWRGGFVPEPSHEALFIILSLTISAAYLWRKARD